MDFRIEITVPTKPENVRAEFEAARDRWLETTAQETDTLAAEASQTVLDTHHEARAPAVKMRANIIRTNNARGLDETHTAILRLMNDGIAAAEQAVRTSTVPVRASIVGRYNKVARDGIYERLSVSFDGAAHG